jgi:hypothetical protein
MIWLNPYDVALIVNPKIQEHTKAFVKILDLPVRLAVAISIPVSEIRGCPPKFCRNSTVTNPDIENNFQQKNSHYLSISKAPGNDDIAKNENTKMLHQLKASKLCAPRSEYENRCILAEYRVNSRQNRGLPRVLEKSMMDHSSPEAEGHAIRKVS